MSSDLLPGPTMPESWQQHEPPPPQRAVATKIQDLVAVRLGRGFVPLALLFVAGVGQLVVAGGDSPDALVLTLGAPAAGGAMLVYGQRIVQRAFGRPHRFWMSLAAPVSLVPVGFGFYVLGWRGLRLLFAGSLAAFGASVLFTVMGAWVMRSWMKIVEVGRLARIMSFAPDEKLGRA